MEINLKALTLMSHEKVDLAYKGADPVLRMYDHVAKKDREPEKTLLAEKYSLSPTNNIYEFDKSGIITIGFDDSCNINLEKIAETAHGAEKARELAKLHEMDGGRISIDSRGIVEFSKMMTNILLHKADGEPKDKYNGSIEVGYDVRKGSDGIYRNTNFHSNFFGLSGRCRYAREGSTDIIYPFKECTVRPKELMTIYIPESEWYRIGEKGAIIATFRIDGEEKTKK